MGNKKNKKGKFKSGTWIDEEMFTSRAYFSLKGIAPQLLTLFLAKRDFIKKDGKYICTNKDKITMTYAELENIYNLGSHNKHLPKDGLKRPSITRGRDDLMAKGFVRIVHQGGGYQQDKTRYALAEDWQWWQPGQVIYKRPKDTRTLGYRNPKKK